MTILACDHQPQPQAAQRLHTVLLHMRRLTGGSSAARPSTSTTSDRAVSANGSSCIAINSVDCWRSTGSRRCHRVHTAPRCCTMGATTAQNAALRLGVIGLDSSHGVGFAQNLASPDSPHKDSAVVVACVTHGTGYKNALFGPVIESMRGNLPKHAGQMAKVGVAVVDTVAELLDQVDAVFLTSWDGRVRTNVCHGLVALFLDPTQATCPYQVRRDQALEVIRGRKPVRIGCIFAGQSRREDLTARRCTE